ncbi:exosporium glycoprotein BclB-related protein [Sporosarcina sp. NCCP-2716]|uniref:exosporium glycoprotein BclB-related protein n=1 Tax=Sporosarcina sp. NCCP-2716 TaxID=2943679 RepID=UPI00203EDE39|nr:exosporium glycoprotein BclB-related protein [Sporosarcina sp. NCCP-2716]
MANYRNNGCRGCGNLAAASYSCENTNDSRKDRCGIVGPIRAIDRECIPSAAARGSIIPFASGAVPVALTSLIGGLVGTPFFIGFGTAVPGVILANNTINLIGLVNEAFTVPRNGTITAISATFTLTAALSVADEAATVTAQIYRAPAGSNTFSPTGVSVDLTPPLTSLLTVGTTLSGSAIPVAPVSVAPGDRLLMVYSLSGTSIASTVAGTASAGITIAE